MQKQLFFFCKNGFTQNIENQTIFCAIAEIKLNIYYYSDNDTKIKMAYTPRGNKIEYHIVFETLVPPIRLIGQITALII